MDQGHADKGITSVVVHHQPGGASSFSLSHNDAPDDRFGSSGKVGTVGQACAPGVNPGQQQHKTVEEQKKDLPDAGPGSFTSVKYSGNPPGGKSSGPLW